MTDSWMNSPLPPTSRGAYAYVATNQTTTSTTPTDLATTGPAVTVVIGGSGKALVTIGSILQNSTLNNYAEMTFAVSGATTLAAGAPYRLYAISTTPSSDFKLAYTVLLTGLTPGSNTFTAKYRAIVGGTALFGEREISVVPT